MKRLDQGHLNPKLEVLGLTCPVRESNPGLHGERQTSWKEPFEQLVNGYLLGTSTYEPATTTKIGTRKKQDPIKRIPICFEKLIRWYEAQFVYAYAQGQLKNIDTEAEVLFLPVSRTRGRRYPCRHPPPHDCTAAKRTSYNFRTENLRHNAMEVNSVADLGYLSRILNFFPPLMPDLGSWIQQQEKEEDKNKSVVKPFL